MANRSMQVKAARAKVQRIEVGTREASKIVRHDMPEDFGGVFIPHVMPAYASKKNQRSRLRAHW